MAETKKISVVITADSKNAEKNLGKVADAVASVGKSASDSTSKMSSMSRMFQSLTSSVANLRKNLGGIDSKPIKDVGDELGKVDTKARKASASIKGIAARCTQMSSALNAIAAIQVGSMFTGIAGSLVSMGVASVQAAAQMRQYEISFQTMLKSAEAGTQMLRDLQQFAADTPFDVPGVVSAGQQLMAFGFKAQEIIPMLRSLGDAASGLGLGTNGVSRLAYALGQMQTSGKLNAQDMMQLTSAGIAAWDMLAQKAGVTVAEMKELCSQGAIDSKAAVQTIIEGMNGQFGGMMDKTSTEITGLMSNIQETVGTTSAVIGDYLIKAFNIKEHLQDASDALGKFQKEMQEAADGGRTLTEVIRDCIPPEVVAAAGALTAAFGILATAAVVAIGGAVGAVLGLSAAMAAAVVAVGAAVALIVVYWEDIYNAIKTVIDGVLNAFLILQSGITECILSVVEFIASALGDLWGTVTGYHNNWFNDFASVMNDALGAVRSFAQQAIDWFAKVFEAKNEAVADAAPGISLDEIGKNSRYAKTHKAQSTAPLVFASKSAGVGGSGGGSGRAGSAENAALKAAQEENRIAQERLKIESNYAKQKLKKEKELYAAQNAIAKQYGTDAQKYALELDEIEFNRKQSLASENLSYQEQLQAAENSLKEAYIKGVGQDEIDLLKQKKQLIEDTHQATLDTINAAATASVNNASMKYDNTNASWQAQYNTASTVGQMTMANDKWQENAIAEANQITDYQEKLALLEQINEKYDAQAQKINTINKIQQFGNSIVKDFSAGIADWVTGAKTFGEAMKNVLKSLIAQLVQAAMYALILASLGIGTGGFAMRFTSAFGKGFSNGGEVNGSGSGTSDSIPAMLSNGEYVLNASAVDRLGVPFLNGLNTGRLQGFATGGLVGAGGAFRSDATASAFKTANTSITLNVSAMDASSFGDFLARGGMRAVKQAMVDDNRNFNAAFETF